MITCAVCAESEFNMNQIQKVYSIRDAKGDVYNQPWYKNTHGEAERDFTLICKNPESMISKFPEDYDLYYLGEYDSKNGIFHSLDTPQHMIKAIAVIPKQNQQLSMLPQTN